MRKRDTGTRSCISAAILNSACAHSLVFPNAAVVAETPDAVTAVESSTEDSQVEQAADAKEAAPEATTDTAQDTAATTPGV